MPIPRQPDRDHQGQRGPAGDDGYVTAAAVCPTNALVKLCIANGIKTQ